MGVLIGGTHRGRVVTGDAVLTRATTTDTRAVKVRLAAFSKAHAALVRAQSVVDGAEAKLAAAQASVADADVTQDESVDALALALVTNGQPRISPFRGLSSYAPTTLKKLGYADEAKLVRALTKKVRARKSSDAAVLRACGVAEKAAAKVVAALAKLPALEASVVAARARRDALSLPWERDFGALKRAARAAADDGAVGLFDALFATTAPAPRRTRKTPAPAPAPTPG